MSYEANIDNVDKQISDYILNDEIGSGGFAKVVQGIHIPTGEKVAIKIMDKIQLFTDPLNLRRVETEISLLKIVRHKNIIKLYEVIETPKKIYLIMEYCEGGELFDYIVKKEHLTERQSCAFFHEIIDALEYLHSINIVHRDLKPENLLLDKINKKLSIKLIDFGISNIYTSENLLGTPCGTASYAPPEMHKGEKYYGLLTDIWSAGVVLYAMVFGYLPFCDENEENNIKNIIEGNYEIPSSASPDLYDLLLHLLDINPVSRYDIEQIKMHPWYNLISSDDNRPGLIIGYHKIPVDERILNICQSYGYDKNEVKHSVINNNYDNNSSIYYIVLNKMKTMGIESISDLNSIEFLNYISDPRNIFFNKNYDYDGQRQHTFKDESSIKNNKSNIHSKKQFKIYDDISPSINIQFSINSKKTKKNNNIGVFNNKEKKNNNYTNNNNEKKYKKNNLTEKNNKNNNNKRKIIYNKKEKDKKVKMSNLNPAINKTLIEKNIKKGNNNKIQKKNNNLILQTNKTFFINSKQKKQENIEDNDLNELMKRNESFNKKLTDDIKEKILKLRNPKINNKKQKLDEIHLKLQLKIKKNKINKNFLKNKKIQQKLFILNKDRKQHTIIHNRNASATPNKYNKNKKNNHIQINYINNNININHIYIQRIRGGSTSVQKKSVKNNPSMIKYQQNILNQIKYDNNLNKNNIPSTIKNNTIDNPEKIILYDNSKQYNHKTKYSCIKSKLSEQRKDFKKILKNIDNDIRCNSARNRKNSLTNRKKIKDSQIMHFLSFLNNNNSLSSNKILNNQSNYILKNSYLNDSLTNKNNNSFYTNFHYYNKEFKNKNDQLKKGKKYNKILISIKKNRIKKSIHKREIKDNCSFMNRSNRLANCISPIHKNYNKIINISNKNNISYNKNLSISMTLNTSKGNTNNCHKKCSSMKFIDNSNSFNYPLEYNNNLNRSYRERKLKYSKERLINKKNYALSAKKNNKRLLNSSSKKKDFKDKDKTYDNKYKSNFYLKKNIINPKKYKGPIDLRNITVRASGLEICDEIINFLKKKFINYRRINPYKIICRKNSETLEINIYILGNNNINKSNCITNPINLVDFYSNDVEVQYNNTFNGFYKNEEITENYNNKYNNITKNIYYINILWKKDKKNNNNKYLFDLINKYIYNKNNLLKYNKK